MKTSSCVPPCVVNMQLLQAQCGGHCGVNVHRVMRLTPFLTFGVVALHQARLPDLYVEGFVLLVLLIVDYFHLDGFTEEVEEEGEEGEEKRQREEKNAEKVRKRTGNQREKTETFGFPTST